MELQSNLMSQSKVFRELKKKKSLWELRVSLSCDGENYLADQILGYICVIQIQTYLCEKMGEKQRDWNSSQVSVSFCSISC